MSTLNILERSIKAKVEENMNILSSNVDTEHSGMLGGYARAQRDVFDTCLQRQRMANLYKRSIFVITETQLQVT